jgi:hypothetical protein
MPVPLSLEKGFGHEGHRVPGVVGHVFQYILEPHELVGHLQQGLEAHVDFGLAGSGHLMVLALHVDAQAFEGQQHLGTQILELVRRGHGKVAFLVARLVAQVGALHSGPCSRSLHTESMA